MIHPDVRIGHVHLIMADLDRAVAFYRDVLGFALTADGRPAGVDAAFLAAGDYHHLNTFEERERHTARAAANDPLTIEAVLAQGSPSNSASTESSRTPGAGDGTVSPRR